MTYKTIFKGRLEFGTTKSYDKVLKMYQHRAENYYRSDILLIEEEIFDEESICLNVPRFITQGSEKSWKNTVSLLEYVAQFAIAGNMGAWMTSEGKILQHGIVEPKSDKAAVRNYLKGKELIKEEGKESEAMEALNRAIEKYSKHAQAYERRGHINLQLKNFDDALYDFTKSIDIAPYNPEPYFGRAHVFVVKEDYKKAVADLEKAIKMSIPLQSIYWKARRLSAECQLKLENFEGALFDLKVYSLRRFIKEDANKLWQRDMTYKYGTTLIKCDKHEESIAVFERLFEMDKGHEKFTEADIYFHRSIARKKAGKSGHLKDLKEAARLGSKAAKAKLK